VEPAAVLTLAIVGVTDRAGVVADTVKLNAEELCPPGLTTATFHVPSSLASLNAGSLSWLELPKVVVCPG
jgi:hypothetical protein